MQERNGDTICHIFGSKFDFLVTSSFFVPRQQPISVWGRNTRACICNTHQRSAILRRICMWRAELDANLSPTISLHNQGNLHAWVLLKVSVISYFLSRRRGRRGDVAAGNRVSYTGDWAQHFCLTFDLIQHISLGKKRRHKSPEVRACLWGNGELPAWPRWRSPMEGISVALSGPGASAGVFHTVVIRPKCD